MKIYEKSKIKEKFGARYESAMAKVGGIPSFDYGIIGLRFVCKCLDWAKDIIFLTVFTHKTAFASIFIGTFTVAPMTFAIM